MIRRGWLSVCIGLGLLGCGAGASHIPTPPGGARPAAPETVIGFHARAGVFYEKLLHKRFNALETFNDPFLRSHFSTEDQFFDYYAILTQAFEEARFERSRPWSVEVEEFVFEGPRRVIVQVRFMGEDNRPMRPDSATFLQRDIWERSEEDWTIRPGKI